MVFIVVAQVAFGFSNPTFDSKFSSDNPPDYEFGGFTLSMTSVNANQGDVVCLPITVNGFNEIIGMQFTIDYDETALSYSSLTNFNLTGLSPSNFGTPDNGQTPGTITMSWLDNTFAGITLGDGTAIFEVCFDVTAANATAAVNFSSTPVAVEIIDANDNELSATTTNATVTIGGGGGGAGNLLLALSDESVVQGLQVCTNVSVDNFIDLIGLQFTINYDPAALSFSSVGGFNLSGLAGSNFGTPVNGTANGVITMSWVDNSFAGITVTDGTEIFEVCFTAIGSGNTPVSFSSTPVAVEALDVNDNEVITNTSNGTVTITGGGGDNMTFFISDETIPQGQQVCVGVTVDGFDDLIGAQFTIGYDPAALGFNAVSGFNLTGLSVSNFGTPDTGTDDGVITMSWTDNTFSGVSVADGTEIFEVCFMANGSAGTSSVNFIASPVGLEVVDVNDNIVTANTSNGSVTITGGNTGGGDGLTISVSDETVAQGASVCVEVSADDFIDIIGAQFTINYNASALTFDNIDAFNLPGLNASNFGNPTAGTLTFSWLDNTFAGVTVPAGTVIFEACFTASGSAGTTAVSIGSSPVTIEFIDANDNEVTVATNNGSVTITDSNPMNPNDGFGFILSEVSGMTGEEVCLDMTVNNFGSIAGMDFSINYNENLLDLSSLGNFNLTGLDIGDFNYPGSGTTPGVITLSWSNGSPISLADGTAVFEVCFDITGTGGNVSAVSFTSAPVDIAVTDGNGTSVETDLDHGSVTIISDGGPTYDGLTFVLSEETATAQGEEVCVELQVYDFSGLIATQYTINYDPAMLDFNSVGNFNLQGLTINNFGTPNNGQTPGTITFSWTDGDFSGENVPDGTAIYEICFTTLFDNGTTPVVFSNSPVILEVINSSDEEVQADTDNGSVTIGGITQADGFALFIEDISATTNDLICLDVSAQDFIDLNGLQFTLNYDAAALQFESVGAFNLPFLSETGNFNTVTFPGQITFTWNDENLDGETLTTPDTTLFQVCFTVIGTSSTTVTFGDSPTVIEAIDINDMIIDPINSEDPGIVTLGVAVPPSITNVVTTDISCNGEDDGVISIDAVSGNGPFAYLWSIVGEDGSTVTGLAPGDYYVTVVDASTTLLTSQSFTVEEPDPLMISDVDIIDVVCSNDTNGSIFITVTGGTTPYTAEWSNGLPDGLEQTNLTAGVYSVTVTDARGCMVSETITLESTNNPIDITSMIPVNVPGGAINLTVAGGTGAGTYNFSWTGPGAYTASTEDISGLTQPGIYCVTVTDNAGCTDEGCVEVGEDIIITSFQITNTCVNESQGAIDIEVSGGVGLLTYQWAQVPGGVVSNDEDISGQPAANYSVTITDVNNNQITGSFEIQNYATLTYDATITPAVNVNDGSIVLNNFMNGTPMSYQWSPNVGDTSFEVYNLTSGQYCVTVTDQNGCETQACYMVPAAPLTFTGEVVTDVTCNTYSDGVIAVTVSGGVPPYTFTNDVGLPAMTNTLGAFALSTLSEGTINYTITDAQGAVISNSQFINQPDAITFNSAVVNDVEGPACSGKIVLNISGGTIPYTVTWNSGIGGTQPIGLCGGDYIPSITDANGCQLFASDAIVVSELSDSVSIADVTCMGDENGIVDLSPFGANNYSFEWREQGSNQIISTNEDLGDFGPGIYTVEITDETGAVLINTYEIGTQSNLDVNVDVTSNFNGYAVKCSDSADGTAVAAGFDGVGVYSYEWELGADLFSVGSNLTDAPAGVYNLIAIDELGCESMETITLSAPTALDVIEDVEAVSCDGLEDGSIEVAGFGGVAEYVYQWSNSNIGSMNNFLIEGDYSLTITDANGCTLNRTYSITEPSPIIVTVDAEPATLPGTGFSDCSGSDGSVSAVVSGGSGNYNYNWLNIEVQDLNQNIVVGLCPGPYYLEVTDSNGCESLSGTVVGEVEDRRFPCLEKRVVITPDGNGSNDNFIIFCIGDYPDNHLEIYNRWGQLVYEVDNYDNDWEGKSLKGEDLPEGPYYYVLEYDTPDGFIQTKGSLTIVR
jgi:gliding motility-associated-like protein